MVAVTTSSSHGGTSRTTRSAEVPSTASSIPTPQMLAQSTSGETRDPATTKTTTTCRTSRPPSPGALRLRVFPHPAICRVGWRRPGKKLHNPHPTTWGVPKVVWREALRRRRDRRRPPRVEARGRHGRRWRECASPRAHRPRRFDGATGEVALTEILPGRV